MGFGKSTELAAWDGQAIWTKTLECVAEPPYDTVCDPISWWSSPRLLVNKKCITKHPSWVELTSDLLAQALVTSLQRVAGGQSLAA